MKKMLMLCIALSIILTGCSWMDGQYHSVVPHAEAGMPQVKDGIAVSSYLQLRDALLSVVSTGTTEATFYITDANAETVEKYMRTAITHIYKNTAIGAYAVKEITYESGTQADYRAVAVDIAYAHGRQEILRVKKVQDMDTLKKHVCNALSNFSDSTVIMVDQYKNLDLVQFVQDYVDENPHVCMEMPQVAVAVYPETGEERIVELSFTYQTSRDVLRSMQESVNPIFSAARMYVQGSADDLQKYEQLFSFLMERFGYNIETSITPAYSLLRYGVGDSKAFATVYSAMCENSGIVCQVVSGTRDGDAWYWNHVKIGDTFYHLDLLESSSIGEFTPVLSQDMNGYVWDYSQFP